MSIAVRACLVGIQYRRYAPKHLKYKGLSIHEIKLLDRVFNGRCDELVSLMRCIQLQQRRHYQQVAVGRENVFEIVRSVDVSGDDVTQNARVFAVQNHRTVQYV